MKTLPSGLATHVAGGTTSLAHLLKITRGDGQIFAFTSANADVTISSQLYVAAPGLNVSSVELSAGLAVDNLELSTLDDGSTFTRADVLGGLWRNATFTLSKYDQVTPANGVDVVMTGTLGNVQLQRGMVTAELRGLQQILQQPVGNVTSKTCRARLGDSLCTLDLAPYTSTGEVASITDNQTFVATGSVLIPANTDVVIQLDGQGTNGSTTFTDEAQTPNTVTPSGTAQISTAQFYYGSASMYFSSSNSALTVPTSTAFDLGTIYTIEFFIRPTSIAGNFGIVHRGFYTTGTTSWAGLVFSIRQLSGTTLRFYFYGVNSATEQYIDVVGALVANTWKHIAMVRNGTTGEIYVDGVSAGTITGLNTPAVSTQTLRIGKWDYSASTEWFSGYLHLRITKGVALYRAAFTPPASFPATDAYYSIGAFDDDYFGEGMITWTSGPNTGLSAKVKSSTAAGSITLMRPMIQTIGVADEFTAIAGCRKRLEDDCATKFDNVLNFQGEPHLPGVDALTSPP